MKNLRRNSQNWKFPTATLLGVFCMSLSHLSASHALSVDRIGDGLNVFKAYVIGDGYTAVAAILGVFGVVRALAASNIQAALVTLGIAAIGTVFISVIT